MAQPSRISFALGDLRTELARLMGRDVAIECDLRLDPNTYRTVVAEIEHHEGQPAKRIALAGARGTGECIKYAGLTISTMLSPEAVTAIRTSVPLVAGSNGRSDNAA